ncbi:MAG: DUF481 domain-containing protein [Gammaproteobacteria bacterium]|nr:DUF481 domain-containing protein [Gammaproteobacteria bacterium]
MKKRVLGPIFFMLLSANAQAIVSMESLHFGDENPGFLGSSSLSIDVARGNAERMRAKGGLTLQWNRSRSIYYSSISAAYGESKNVRDQNEWFMHGRRIGNISDMLAWEVFAQLEREEFARLNLRTLGGSGVRIQLGQKRPQQAFFLGVGAFYSHELINDTTKTVAQEVKGNIYLLFKRSLSNHASFVNTLYWQPNATSLSDYRLLETATLSAKILERLALKISLELRQDSRPPATVKQTDMKLLTGIEFNF